MEMKEFTEDDWETFAGAESPEGYCDYGEPFIGYFKWSPTSKQLAQNDGGVVVVDKHGICIIPDPNADYTSPALEEFRIECPFLTGLKIVALLPDPLDIEDDLGPWGFDHPMFDAWENN